jgi:hypothetical protein
VLIYHDKITGEISFTIITQAGIVPPGDYIEVPDDTPVDPISQIVLDGILYDRPTVSDAQRALALERITKQRGRARAMFVTDIPGQDMVYLEKRSEAVAYLNDANPDPDLYPMVIAEVGVTGDTPYEVAQVWLNMNDMWRYVSTTIERVTLKATNLVNAASQKSEIDAAMAEIDSSLALLGLD